jgi:hypothetical protein
MVAGDFERRRRPLTSAAEALNVTASGTDWRYMPATDIGHINPRGQRVVRRVGPSPTVPGKYTYELECMNCGTCYGANGPDINGAGAGRGRRCPNCQDGVPGDPV